MISKKKYTDQNKYKIYNCQYRRKNEKFRVNKGNFCNSQILLEISNNDNILINNNFKILSTLSKECIELNFQNIPEVKENLYQIDEFHKLIYKYLENITFYDIILKIIYLIFIMIKNILLNMILKKSMK